MKFYYDNMVEEHLQILINKKNRNSVNVRPSLVTFNDMTRQDELTDVWIERKMSKMLSIFISVTINAL